MSILCDCNQFLISSMLVNNQLNHEVDLYSIKKLFIRQLNNYIRQFPNYSGIILCFDNQNYWRKSVFEYYKYSRKNDRKNSSTDWTKIFNDINDIKQELIKSNYNVVDIPGAEADDIIACISKHEYENKINTLIISGDKDFIQLLKYNTVSIWNHQKKILLTNNHYEANFL